MPSIPKKLQGVLWSVDVNQLDLERDKNYIIHQVLHYGTLEDLRWLLQTYPKPTIIEVFIKHPMKIYFKPVFHFIKNFVLGLKDVQLDEDAYTTSISGPVRPRTAKRI